MCTKEGGTRLLSMCRLGKSCQRVQIFGRALGRGEWEMSDVCNFWRGGNCQVLVNWGTI